MEWNINLEWNSIDSTTYLRCLSRRMTRGTKIDCLTNELDHEEIHASSVDEESQARSRNTGDN